VRPATATTVPTASPAPARRRTADYWRHDPRLEPPTAKDKRRLWAWVGFLGFTPVCLGGVLWAAFHLNGGYPTVPAPVPPGWQAVPGIYASFSAPRDWSLQQFMSDSAGDIYYSGPGGGVGESVTAASAPPSPRHIPAIVTTFLVNPYKLATRQPYQLHNATAAWRYTFDLAGGKTGVAILAWVASTRSVVWLVATPRSATTDRILATLTLAS